jgi:hypothetical protein
MQSAPLEFTQDQCLDLVTNAQYAILEHLCVVAVQQKAQARYSKTKFRGGWTHVRTNQHVKLASVRALIRLGLVSSCCEGHDGTDNVRISRKGVEFLEFVRGETILA